jgi:hypothetical protein
MELICHNCGQPISLPAADQAAAGWSCPACGESFETPGDQDTEAPVPGQFDTVMLNRSHEVPLIQVEIQGPPDLLDTDSGRNDATAVKESVESVFQPVLAMDSMIRELSPTEQKPDLPTEEHSGEPATEMLPSSPEASPAPYLELDIEPYLLLLGAAPGNERRPLVRARTTFGRKRADEILDDPSVSAVHFQIEAFGKEFFVRDLKSRNGTFLNGAKIDYSQLLPGDQITAGRATLIFRLSDDEIDRT